MCYCSSFVICENIANSKEPLDLETSFYTILANQLYSSQNTLVGDKLYNNLHVYIYTCDMINMQIIARS